MKNSYKIVQPIHSAFWALNMLFRTAPVESVCLFLFVIFQGIIPTLSLFAIQSIIDWINSVKGFPIGFVSLWAGMLFADIALSPLISIVRLHLNEKILAHCNLLLMEKANTFESLIPFENSEIYDEIQFLRGEAARRPLNFIYILTSLLKDCVSLTSILFLLAIFEWWIPLGILSASLPHALATLWFEKQSWDQMLFRSPESRKMAWLSSLALNDRSAKEVRLFGFGEYLIARYKELVRTTYDKIAINYRAKSIWFVFVSTFTVLGNLLVISFILLDAKKGVFGIGGLVIAIQALVMTQSQLISLVSNIGMCTPCLLFFGKLKLFLTRNFCPLNSQKQNIDVISFQEIKFENVSFSYPDGRHVISNVSFAIKKGEKLAIVGENGTGKSTIVKLLLRFYDPTAGKITIDGRDLKETDLKAWRRSISAVFQDFGQYHFTIGENVALGDVNASQKNISKAIHKGGFHPILERLPNGLNTKLGKEFDGTSLSGGEWQKLAMSRAFLRDASLLILDEPTSSLDPHSEQEVFKKFSDHIEEKTALLITHRLGSIKMADRIIVLKNGMLIESGTHQQLVMARGEYHTLYNIQAKQYQIE